MPQFAHLHKDQIPMNLYRLSYLSLYLPAQKELGDIFGRFVPSEEVNWDSKNIDIL